MVFAEKEPTKRWVGRFKELALAAMLRIKIDLLMPLQNYCKIVDGLPAKLWAEILFTAR